ncbi:MAG: cytidine deaminase [Candidatus Aphodosoma sp.]
MQTKHIDIPVEIYSFEELSAEERQLVEAAKEATVRAYSPYSHFQVGAAVSLSNGEIVTGTNQENAAYPSGLCAERTAMFYANSRYPGSAPRMMAVAAFADGGFTSSPVTPCGSCRQVLSETEKRFRTDIPVILYGTGKVYKLRSIQDLLPLAF